MKPYHYYLFDWDGCLAKTLEVWLGAYRVAINDFGAHPSDQEIAHYFGEWDAARHFGVEDVEACWAQTQSIVQGELTEVDMYPGAKDLLVALKDRGHKIALLSSSGRSLLEAGIAHNGLDGVFDVVLSADEVTNHKPDPEVIEKGLAELHGEKRLAVMIGDSRKDLGAAQNAVIDSVLMYPPQHTLFYDIEVLKTYQPTYIFDGFTEFMRNVS